MKTLYNLSKLLLVAISFCFFTTNAIAIEDNNSYKNRKELPEKCFDLEEGKRCAEFAKYDFCYEPEHKDKPYCAVKCADADENIYCEKCEKRPDYCRETPYDKCKKAITCYDKEKIFPVWFNQKIRKGDIGEKRFVIKGIIGSNENLNEDNSFVSFLPKIYKIFISLITPLITVMFIWAGVKLLHGNDDEEEINKTKEFLRYAFMGILFIAISYSLVKMIYYLILK